jgi:hypothetical protein
MKKLFVLSTLVPLFFSLSAKAGLTNAIYWNFGPPTASVTSNSFPGLTAGTFTQGNNNGTTPVFSPTSPSSIYTTAAGFTASGSTNAGAAVGLGALNTATTPYLGFTLSLSSSSTLSYTLSDVSFGSRSTSTGPQTLSLYESTDGFSTDFTALGTVSVLANSAWTAIDFSGLNVALLNDDSTLSFRIYAYGDTGNPSPNTANWRIDDVAAVLNASVVPEPSTTALAIISGVAGIVWLRRRR